MTQALEESVKLLHGPGEVEFGPEELVVLCLVRDGLPYVEAFVEHYLSVLGARHLVFLDNGSEDGTVEALRSAGGGRVSILHSALPYKGYKYLMKQYLHGRFGGGRWTLYTDIDELFDYPRSSVVDLGTFLKYLNDRSYTTVVAQMLDMFPERFPPDGSGDLKETHRFYDISGITFRGYKDYLYQSHRALQSNSVYNEEIVMLNGGIRKTLFGAQANLTKHPLVFSDGRARPADGSSHWTTNARVADVSCVLYHYKFVEGFREQAQRAVREENYYDDSAEYRKYLEVLGKTPAFDVRRPTSRELGGVNELVEEGFLFASEEYAKWADEEERRRIEHGALRADPVEAILLARSRERAKVLKMQALSRQVSNQRREIWRLKREMKELREADPAGK